MFRYRRRATGANLGAAHHYADDGLRHERPSGRRDEGRDPRINPEVNVVDITHGVLAHDVLDGALTIAQAYKYFPPKTIHVVVVDPGVGTARRPILVAGDQHYFVAPDNGVLSGVYDQTEALYVWNIISEHYFRNPVSNTFHGRDIFAPVAAWLSKSWQTSTFGEPITDFVRFAIPKPKAAGNTVKGVVLRVDHFGNLITNITRAGCSGAGGRQREIHDSRGECRGEQGRSDIRAGRGRRGGWRDRIERLPRNFREQGQRRSGARHRARRRSDRRAVVAHTLQPGLKP